MKRAFVFISLFVLVACQQEQKILNSVVTPKQPDDTTELVSDMAESLPAITLDNALELEAGQRYRMIPTEVDGGKNPHAESKIWSVSWGSIGGSPKEVLEGFTDNDPKIFAWFSMANAGQIPYTLTLEGKKVIEEGDEIVIEIVEPSFVVEQEGGSRNNKFVFTLAEYSAILIENLTQPDITFEY